jgi:hypothetical protein
VTYRDLTSVRIADTSFTFHHMHHVFQSPYGLNNCVSKVKVAEIQLALIIALSLTEVASLSSCTNYLRHNGKTELISVLSVFIKVELGLCLLSHVLILKFVTDGPNVRLIFHRHSVRLPADVKRFVCSPQSPDRIWSLTDSPFHGY